VLEQNLSLKQLYYFLRTAKHSSLRQAARELGITQPSLSAQLKALENTLGVALFERTRGGVTITPIGKKLLGEAQIAVDAAQSIVDSANAASKGPSGTFSLGVSPSVGPYSFPWVLPAIRRNFPGVKFYVKEAAPSYLIDGIINNNYDLIFTPLPVDTHSLTITPVFREPLYLVVNSTHKLAKYESIEASQLEGLDILTVEEHHHFHRQVESLSERFNAHLLRDFEGSSLDAIRQMVYMEMGVAFLPALYIRSEIRERDELRVLKVRDESFFRVHAFAWRNTSPARHFYSELAAYFKVQLGKQLGDSIILM